MKLPINNFKTFAKDVFKRKQSATANRLIKPRRDWVIGLCIGVGILISIMSWSAYMYTSNRTVDIQPVDDQTVVPTYRAATVAEALELFATRKIQHDSLLDGVTVPTPVPTSEEAGGEGQTTDQSDTATIPLEIVEEEAPETEIQSIDPDAPEVEEQSEDVSVTPELGE